MPEVPVMSRDDQSDSEPIAIEESLPGHSAPVPPKPSATARNRAALDVGRLRHPSEPSRFALAASASVLLVGLTLLLAVRLAGVIALASAGLALLTVWATIWWAVQVYRAKLLGAAARVTPETFPVLAAAAAEVKRQVGYVRPVEIFVVAHADESASLTSFFGTRVLLMEGDLVADLVKPEHRAQLDFVLATFFAKLKVKALAWTPLLVAIDALNVPRVLSFFIAPWERAAVYTGDQVAATCCGSLDESVIALNRLLVGKDLAHNVGANGLLDQAVSVRRRWLPRLQQLYSSYPHLTNRYLNLLSFASHSAPDQARAFHERLDPHTDTRVMDASARLTRRHQRGPRRALPRAVIGASIALLGMLGFLIFSVIPQHDLVTWQSIMSGNSSSSSASPTGTPATSPPSPPPSSPVPQASTDPVTALRSHVPAAFASTCHAVSPQTPMTGLVAAIGCAPSGDGAPASVEYYQFDTVTDMNTIFDDTAASLPQAEECDQSGERGDYQFTHSPGAGSWACYYDSSDQAHLIWTNTGLDILTAASDPTQTPGQLDDWFLSPADTGPN